MTKISVKTGDETSAESDAVADVRICDGLGTCCSTLGLNNAGNDRQKGLTDVYSSSYLLSNCSEVGQLRHAFTFLHFFLSRPLILLATGLLSWKWRTMRGRTTHGTSTGSEFRQRMLTSTARWVLGCNVVKTSTPP